MARHSSATLCEETSTAPDGKTIRREETSKLREEISKSHQEIATQREEKSTLRERDTDKINSTVRPHVIDASLKRRARLLITNSSIPGRTRSLIRYALEIKDPYLDQVVRRVEAGEMTIDHLVLEED